MKNISEYFGCLVFDDRVMKANLSSDVYQSLRKTIDEGTTLDLSVANAVADAMAEKLEKEFTVGTEGKITGIISGPVKVTTQSNTAITKSNYARFPRTADCVFQNCAGIFSNERP